MNLRERYQQTLQKLAQAQADAHRYEGQLAILTEQINEAEATPAGAAAPNRAERRRRGRPAAGTNGTAQPTA